MAEFFESLYDTELYDDSDLYFDSFAPSSETINTYDDLNSYFSAYDQYNISVNDTDDPEIQCPKGPTAELPIIFSVIAFFGLLGNVLVITIIIKLKEFEKSITSYYVFQLAVADFLFVFVIPFEVVALVHTDRWIFGTAWCKITQSIRMLNYYASIAFLTMMSMDRYFAINAIKHSSRYEKCRTKRFAAIISAIIWLLGCTSVIYVLIKAIATNCLCLIEFGDETPNNVKIPHGFFRNISEEDIQHFVNLLPGHCSLKGYDVLNLWIIVNFIVAFAIPLLIICACYILLIRRLRESNLATDAAANAKKKQRRNKKITSMVTSMIVVFIFCWLPYHCFKLSQVNDNQMSKYDCDRASHVTLLFAYMNSALNPYLYIMMKYKAVKKILMDGLKKAGFVKDSYSMASSNPGSSERSRRLQRQANGRTKQLDQLNKHSYNTKHSELLSSKDETNFMHDSV